MKGFYNLKFPGPLGVDFHGGLENCQMIQSLPHVALSSPPAVNEKWNFDELEFPYCLPVHFCTEESKLSLVSSSFAVFYW